MSDTGKKLRYATPELVERSCALFTSDSNLVTTVFIEFSQQ